MDATSCNIMQHSYKRGNCCQLILCNIMAILALNFAQDGATAVNCNIEKW